MLISHEVPISFWEEYHKFYDYGYYLVHLFSKYPEYKKQAYKEIKERVIYLDNSLYELGRSFDPEEFKKECIELGKINSENFYYVVPDDICYETNLEMFDSWDYKNVPGKRIAVLHGENEIELTECFKYLRSKLNKDELIAIPFGNSTFKIQRGIWTIEESLAYNRSSFVKNLKRKGLLKNTKIHLLGCSVPQEILKYKGIPEVFSIDSSNPVVHGIEGIRYKYTGLKTKSSTKIESLIDTKLTQKQIQDVCFNIGCFRGFNLCIEGE